MPRPASARSAATAAATARWGRDHQALVAVHQPDHRHVADAGNPVQVGHRVLADGRVQQMRAGQVAEPVAQSHQPAEGADVRRGQGEVRILGAQRRGGQVEDEVVRADGHDRAGDLVEAAQQFDADLLPRVVPLEPGRHDQQPVGANQRGQHAGAAGQRGGGVATMAPPTTPSRTRTQSSIPSGVCVPRIVSTALNSRVARPAFRP
jgi:hypothetical protein